MTDDIVARLALHANVRSTPDSVSAVLLEARDEIERLRAALKAMTYAYPYSVPCVNWEPKARARNLACAALAGGKTNDRP